MDEWAESGREGTAGVGPRRVSVHPELGDGDRRRLAEGLARKAKEVGQPSDFAGYGNPEAESVKESSAALRVLLLSMGMVLAVVMLNDPAVFVLLLVPSMAVGGAAYFRHGRLRALREHRAAREAVEDAVDELQGFFVSGDMLDTSARRMLGRTQRAVDCVLGSDAHRRGLLLDEVRNRVVLADAEWAVAQCLLRQSRTRQRIEATPLVGERSRRAAERARGVLEEDVAEVGRRIRTLEDYAHLVRAAELEEQDRRTAAELDALADRTAEAGAAHPHQEEALSHLVQAQALALRVAALTTDP